MFVALTGSILKENINEAANHKNSANINGRMVLSRAMVVEEILVAAIIKRLFCIYVPRLRELLYICDFAC